MRQITCLVALLLLAFTAPAQTRIKRVVEVEGLPAYQIATGGAFKPFSFTQTEGSMTYEYGACVGCRVAINTAPGINVSPFYIYSPLINPSGSSGISFHVGYGTTTGQLTLSSPVNQTAGAGINLTSSNGAFSGYMRLSGSGSLVLGSATPIRAEAPVMSRWASGTTNPSGSDVPAGFCMYWKNTTANELRHWCNDGGTLIRSAPFTTN